MQTRKIWIGAIKNLHKKRDYSIIPFFMAIFHWSFLSMSCLKRLFFYIVLACLYGHFLNITRSMGET